MANCIAIEWLARLLLMAAALAGAGYGIGWVIAQINLSIAG